MYKIASPQDHLHPLIRDPQFKHKFDIRSNGPVHLDGLEIIESNITEGVPECVNGLDWRSHIWMSPWKHNPTGYVDPMSLNLTFSLLASI